MNEQLMRIMRYLEDAYTGARMFGDAETMIRISRALAAFGSDIQESENEIFTEEFLDEYYSRI